MRLKIFGRLFIITFKYGSGVCHVMLRYGILKYFCPILDKKVPPKDKELYSIRPGHYQRFACEGYKLVPIVSCNDEVTKIETVCYQETNYSIEI